MKIAFRTIEIQYLVISYVGVFGILLVLNYFFDLNVHAIFFLLLPVALYFIFRGKVEVNISRQKLNINWLRKPMLGPASNKTIELSEVIRWKYEHSFRGPDQLTLILESGKKIKIRPDLFSFRDVETKITKALGEKISEANSGISKEDLHEKILKSKYVQGLEKKLQIVRLLLWITMGTGLSVLMAGIFFPDSRFIWILFSIFFGCAILIFLRHLYLENERKNTLRLE